MARKRQRKPCPLALCLVEFLAVKGCSFDVLEISLPGEPEIIRKEINVGA